MSDVVVDLFSSFFGCFTSNYEISLQMNWDRIFSQNASVSPGFFHAERTMFLASMIPVFIEISA